MMISLSNYRDKYSYVCTSIDNINYVYVVYIIYGTSHVIILESPNHCTVAVPPIICVFTVKQLIFYIGGM